MRISTAIALIAALFTGLAGGEDSAMTPRQFGALVHNEGCKQAEATVLRQPDPDFFLGIMYDIGLCRTPSVSEALNHYLRSAERGNDEAMYEVFLEISKKSTPQHHLAENEFELSRHWLIKAGEKNNWRAAEVLALCYEKGCWGLPIDLEKAKHYKSVFEKYGPNQSFNRDAQQQASPAAGAR